MRRPRRLTLGAAAPGPPAYRRDRPLLRQLLRLEAEPLLVAGLAMVVLAASTALAAILVGPLLDSLLGSDRAFAAAAPAGPWRLTGTLGTVWTQRFAAAVAANLPTAAVAVALVQGGAYFVQFDRLARVGQRTASRLRQRLLAELLDASPAWLGGQQTGELLSRFTGDVAAVELYVSHGLASYLRDGISAGLLAGVCLATDWRLTGLLAIAVPLGVVPLRRLWRRLRAQLRGSAASQGLLGHLVAEGLQGLPSLQVDGLQAREADRFQTALTASLAHGLGAARARALLGPTMEVVAAAGLCSLLAVAAAQIASGSLDGARLASFLAAGLLLAQPLKALGKVGHFVAAGQVALQRLEATFASLADDRLGRQRTGGKVAGPLRRGLSFRGVTFAYGGGASHSPASAQARSPAARPTALPAALADLTFEVTFGERIALVGASGAGKSTLFALLLGLQRPQAGELLYDGQPLESFDPSSLRRQLGWLGQETFLFDGSVAENLALGDPAPDAARLRAAASRAQALAFIERAGGFAAPVGERGRRFSGGERQRLGIARALYQDASLLLLDEPTSALDPENEAALGAALGELLRGRTSLTIAHRLSTVRGCDRALVLEHGRLVEVGRPDELLARGGPFARLFGAADRAGGRTE